MNERIEELSLQCIRYKLVAEGARSDFDYKKFAELMVEECCQVLSKETIRHDGYGYNQHALYQKIREHFGVE